MTERGSQRLRRGDRLRERRDFQRASREGLRVSSRSFVLLLATRADGVTSALPRLGITASRRVGPSVVRSLVKRRIREWFRRHRAGLPRSRDLVVVARTAAATASQRVLEAELNASAVRLGKLFEERIQS